MALLNPTVLSITLTSFQISQNSFSYSLLIRHGREKSDFLIGNTVPLQVLSEAVEQSKQEYMRYIFI